MKTVVLLSHRQKQCGVHQFGEQLSEALTASTKFDFKYCEVGDIGELPSVIEKFGPAAILVNYHVATIGWLDGWPLWPLWSLGVPVIGIMHELTDTMADRTDATRFDSYILHDPAAKFKNPLFFKAGRLLRPLKTDVPPPARTTIGSFGFATAGKNFEGLVARAHAEFDDCLIRLSIAFNDIVDKDGTHALALAKRLPSLISKPGVELEITHEFFELDDMVSFLAGNSLNGFLYDSQDERGLSSAIDLALVAGRPIALRRGTMFRHLFGATPSIFVEERSLREIMETGTEPLQPYIKAWTNERVREEYEEIVQTVLDRWHQAGRNYRLRRQIAALAENAELKAAEATARAVAAEHRAALADAARHRTLQEIEDRDARLVQDLETDLEVNSRALKFGLRTARTIRSGVRLLTGRRTRSQR